MTLRQLLSKTTWHRAKVTKKINSKPAGFRFSKAVPLTFVLLLGAAALSWLSWSGQAARAERLKFARSNNGTNAVVAAATLNVNSTADDTLANLALNATCDLREAIEAANTGTTVGQCLAPAPDTAYTINLPAGTITLTGAAIEDANASGDLDLTAVVTYTLIGNAGGTIIDGGLNDRHFDVRVAGVTLELQSLTLRNGRDANDPNGGGGSVRIPSASGLGSTLRATNVVFSGNEVMAQGGGAINNQKGRVELNFTSFFNNRASNDAGGAYSSNQDSSVLVVNNSRFEGNQAASRGGAIANFSGAFTITDSLFVNNSADDGGALYNNEDQAPYTISGSVFTGNNAPRGSALFLSNNSTQSNITINNSTFTGNVAPDRASSGGSGAEGGAILVSGSSSAVTLRHVTLAQNQGVNRPGGLRLQSGDANILNTIIANNTGGNCLLNGSSAMITGANNLTDAAGMCSPGFTVGNPVLGPLSYNGGPLAGAPGAQVGIPTMLPLPGSAAINTGDNVNSLPTDQRGVTRPQPTGGTVDIGAVEVACPTITATVTGGGMICPGGSSTVTVTLSGGTANYTVTLNNGGGTLTGPSPLVFTVTPATTTIYSVQSGADANGCPVTGAGSATVTVGDTTAPVIACNLVPAQTATANSNCQAATPDMRALVRAQSSDNCTTQANLTVTQSPAVGALVGLGSNPITVTVTDASNNQTTCVIAFTVSDTTAPVITCPANLSVGATSATGRTVSYAAPTTSDNCAGVGAPVCVPASGSNFPIGVTTVTCTVSDAAGNTASCSFTITVNRESFSISDPLVCTGPGNTVTGAFSISNNGNATVAVTATVALPAGLVGIPNSGSANIGSVTVTSTSVSFSANLPAGQTAMVSYLAQVGDQATPGTSLCSTLTVTFGGGPAFAVQACASVTCQPVGPGAIPPATSEMSDQKTGSVLIYNIYTSSTDPTRQNTRINITNTHPTLPAFVHLFFVAEGCSVADSYICLTGAQTASFLSSDLDPGTTGYLVAIASDALGCPTSFNYLIGDEYVKFASGHAANLGAEAISALAGGLPNCRSDSVTAQVNFDGVSYNRVPRTVAASNIGSRADGNDTLLILNRIGGNLGTGAATLGTIFGIFYNDAEAGLSFSINGSCQFRSAINNNVPRLTPRFETFVPAGRTGWFKVFSQSDIGITGSIINFNPNTAASAGAFSQGHNLHTLTLTSGQSYVLPVFPPSC